MKTTENLQIQNFKTLETNRGLAYTADILLEDNKVATLENPGDGSYTRIHFFSNKEEIHQMMYAHFKELGMNTDGEKEYALEYTFAEHLIDIKVDGKLAEERMELGIMC